MDPKNDEQTELLRHIWNEMKALGQNLGGRIDHLGGRIDHLGQSLGARIDALEHQLSGRIDETNARLDQTNTRLGAVEEAVRDLAASSSCSVAS